MVVEQDTIAAIATALGEASVGIIRVSGPSAKQIAEMVFKKPSGRQTLLGSMKEMRYGVIVDPKRNQIVDEGILLWMPGPKSYTAEDVVEFQVHGGVQLAQHVLKVTLQSGARMAEPGEFTKRAFLNGRIDLSQAEAVIDLIRAKTDFASQAAIHQVKGHFRDQITKMRKELIGVQAHVEVTIDYPEHDVESLACDEVVSTCDKLLSQIRSLIDSARVGHILREGVKTVIVGRPNVGKSSLLNAMLRRERAIVTDIPGTTRDVLEEYVNIRGIPLRLVDTAGIRETSDIVEKIGVDKSREMIEEAELTLVVLDSHEPLEPEDKKLLAETASHTRIIILNKSDLPQAADFSSWNRELEGSPIVQISAKDAEGIGELEDRVEQLIFGGHVVIGDTTYMTNERQAQLLELAFTDLKEARDAAAALVTLDLVAVQLQSVYAELGLVIGEEVNEDLLDEIFSKFCLGK
jgi:tRNA modification GTPase